MDLLHTKDDLHKVARVIDRFDNAPGLVSMAMVRLGLLGVGPISEDPISTSNLLAIQGTNLWRSSAYPHVAMGHRYAAMLISTKVTPEVRAMARLPWSAVWFDIPRGLLDVPEERVLPSGVLAWNPSRPGEEATWQMWCPSGQKVICGPIRGTEKGPLTESAFDPQMYVQTGTAADRVMEAVSRLIINSCLAMSDPTNIRNLPPGSGGSLRNSKEPTHYVYQLGKPPNVDCRPALQEYLRGTRKGASPTVQTLVAGHWKPKLGERVGRPVYVEPYWRGPEDAPIKVQQKVLEPPTP